MKRRTLILAAGLVAAATVAAWALERTGAAGAPELTVEVAPRIASLSPALTETLVALGSRTALVAVSDYCQVEGEAPPRVGTSITPSIEALARLRPSVVVTQRVAGGRDDELRRLTRVESLPWLTVQDVAEGTRRLGALVGRTAAAEALASRYERELGAATPPSDAPRVLAALHDGPQPLGVVWFLRRNSLHGAALSAAGARNAVDEDVTGAPRLSLERLVALDPDAILVLAPPGTPADQARARWQSLDGLRAVREGRVAVVVGDVLGDGPGLLELVPRLREQLRTMFPSTR